MHSGDPDPDFQMRIARLAFGLTRCRQFLLLSLLGYWSLHRIIRLRLYLLNCVDITNRVRKDCSSGSLEVDRVFELSPDTAGLVHTTVPVAPEPFDASLPPAGAESCLLLMLDGTISYNPTP